MIDHAISGRADGPSWYVNVHCGTMGPAERAHGARRARVMARRAIVGALCSAAAYFGFALSVTVLLAAATLLRG